MQEKTNIPLDVPFNMKEDYLLNFKKATEGKGKMLIIAGDQRIEHLNADFYGKNIHPDDADPEHLFRIAESAGVGVLACQLGLISKYGSDYRGLRYLVKLNSKTNLSKAEPFSEMLTTVKEVNDFKKETGLSVVGVGYTLYLGSKRESEMLKTAADVVREAHGNGLIVVLWAYPRGKAVKDETDPHLIAGAVGVAVSLGADFVKVNCPKENFFKEVGKMSSKTGILCAGGEAVEKEKFLETCKKEMELGGAGIAVGRNIHQKGLKEAVDTVKALHQIIFKNA